MKKVIHLIPDEKFTDFVIDSFNKVNNIKNYFFCFVYNTESRYTRSLALEAISLADIEKGGRLRTIFEEADIIMVHILSLNHSKAVLLFPSKKIVWFCWGGEIYNHHPKLVYNNYKYLTRKIRTKLNPFFFLKLRAKSFLSTFGIRKDLFFYQNKAVRFIDIICPVILEDYNIIISNYPVSKGVVCGKFIYGNMATLISRSYKNTGKSDRVLIGNSATLTNNHLDVFELMSRMDKSDLPQQIIVPLTYGDDDYKKIVIDHGNRIFGESFMPLDQFMDIDDYLKLISSCRYFILPVCRQQGMGNVYAMLYYGATIYVYKDSPIYRFLRRENFSFRTIEDLCIEKVFKELNETQILRNREKIELLLDETKTEGYIKSLIDL
ncbi:4-alpha-L-fucosyltransferase (glycosyl transferase family 56) [Sphingobacterium allocomposti]|uniref:4-alpha-L-fucosyltransferase (Glycosyl transferase family 56) n=1 Tax=Sphingobacterium allocomposti TaxID=415956 RepID=A0A5S5DFA8_9SPHI|nr:TDP-N-acetylfucosamine:lipid II N-acetylfucosaminyltransferase [Sphingobacterium composti Yoo et al. 2007 non Ten et al. 2007]TYP94611.1 4-alpha-L-fucosyltransferase (glycosyl transferase family 56) [Sphingobacterium composti Yoo et al. 2007 non Ten et al. 2007]